MRHYKIRNKAGLFSTGGISPRFNKAGKSWQSLSHLKTHLGQFKGKPHRRKVYRDCEIVAFEMQPVECVEINLDDIFEEFSLEDLTKKLSQ